MINIKIYVECIRQIKNHFRERKNTKQRNSQEICDSEISKGKSFTGVLKQLIASIEGNKMKLLQYYL